MEAKNAKAKGPGKPGPDELQERLQGYWPEAIEATLLLLTDKAMDSCWQRDFGMREVAEAAHLFELANNRDAWSDKTQRERDEWRAKFDKIVEQFITHVQDGPRTPSEWGYPVKDSVLMNLLYLAGYDVPEDEIAGLVRAREIDAIADSLNWSIVDSLRHYQRQIHADCVPTQPLKKPRDGKAARAEFIVGMVRYTQCSALTIARVAATMFQDPSIDDRLVRRLATGR